MALQEYYTRTDGIKIILRQSNDGRWSVKCMTPPAGPTTQWDVAWEVDGTTANDLPVNADQVAATGCAPVFEPFNEQRARETYERYMG